MSKAIFIEPLDVLLFRDGKPFTGGEDHLARSVFPPPPSTVYAAMRSHLLSYHFGRLEAFKEGRDVPASLAEEIGSPDRFGTLELRQLFVACRRDTNETSEPDLPVKRFYPMPCDFGEVKGPQPVRYLVLTPADGLPVQTDLPSGLWPFWSHKDLPLDAASGWLTEAGMQRYLQGAAYFAESRFPLQEKEAAAEVIAGDSVGKGIFQREERTGIARDRARRSVREGLLYSVEYIRLRPGVGLFVELEGTRLLPDSGLISLGGDRRPAHYQAAQAPMLALDNIKEQILARRRFKLVLTTPALFERGWCPRWINEQTLEGTRDRIRVKLIAASIGKPVAIGGFDLVKQFPKPVHRFVPAGSVYFFQLLEGDADSVVRAFHQRSISEDMETFPETAKQGFGHSLIGAW